MNVFSYLPSAQFVLIVASVTISGGLVVAAQYFTKAPTYKPTLVTVAPPIGDTNWKGTLAFIQSQNPLGNLPPVPNPDAVENLLGAAKSENLTNTVARTLFVSLSDAKAQGLGSDLPTQEALIAQAKAEIEQTREETLVFEGDIETTLVTSVTLKTYGNAVMRVLSSHPKASYSDTLFALSAVIDTAEISKISDLTAIGDAYTLLAEDLKHVIVPQTLVPLHLKVVNNFFNIAHTYEEMGLLATDPLKALSGLERYQTLIGETNRVFTNIAQELSKNSILFSKGEPGESWSLLLLQ